VAPEAPDPAPASAPASTRRLGSLLLAGLLLAGGLWAAVGSDLPAAPIAIGQPAPEFRLPALAEGDEVSLEGLRGQVVLLNFWATWCKPCEDEMPAMERLHQALAPEGLALVAISVDDGREKVAAFRDRLGLTFPILLDPSKRVARDYQSLRFPETYLIDREGTLVARYIGPREWDAPEYQDRIRRLLQE